MTGKLLRSWVALAVLLAGLATVRPAHASPLDAKREEAAALEARIREQGQRLSLADEQFNQARIARQQVEARAGQAETKVDYAEQKWGEYKDQLARRVRLLYMHPTAAIEAMFAARTVGEVARARHFGSSVLTADTELVMATERARQELLAQARVLDGLRAQAERQESVVAESRSSVQQAIGSQRRLLSGVRGDIGELIAEQRAQALRQAAAAAPAPAPPAPTRPAIGDGGDGPAAAATPEPAASEAETAPAAPPAKGSAGKAVATAAAQIGKPYEWAADGPDSYDCSGLTMYAWASAGVSLPHSSQAQYNSLPHVARDQIQPGDLLFYGSPIHHVGIYEGGGVMINAPETGEYVRRDSISRSDYAGAARP